MGEAIQVYEEKMLDKLANWLIGFIAQIIDVFKPGWKKRNTAKLSEWKLMLYALNRSVPGLVGLVLVIVFICLAIFGPLIAPYKYNNFLIFQDLRYRFLSPFAYGPNKEFFLLGTDEYGRDVLSLLLYGARVSLIVSLLVIAISFPIGVLLGLVAGYFGGKIDEVIMRITDIFFSFPGLILAIGLSTTLPSRINILFKAFPGFQDLMLWLFAIDPVDSEKLSYLVAVVFALVVVWWPPYTRVIRGSTLAEREKVYIEAAKAMGLSPLSIMLKHIFPNIMGPMLVYITLDLGGVILSEAGLSYLGVGAQPPIADWGRIVFDGSRWLYRGYWWLSLLPGAFILLTALGYNLLGDALRDILDPKTRRSIEFKLKKGGKKS